MKNEDIEFRKTVYYTWNNRRKDGFAYSEQVVPVLAVYESRKNYVVVVNLMPVESIDNYNIGNMILEVKTDMLFLTPEEAFQNLIERIENECKNHINDLKEQFEDDLVYLNPSKP